MKISIFTTVKNPELRGDPFREAMANYNAFADEVVVVDGSKPFTPDFSDRIYRYWPREFKWSFIGEQFQRGYEACKGDWVIHMDLDFFFHEKDFQAIKELLGNTDKPAVAFPKRQFFTRDSYNVKSLLTLAVNKGKYGDQIKFDGGGKGDLCQPSLNGELLDPHKVKYCNAPFYNYDDMWKTKAQIMDDKGRFARAWYATFGNYKLGGPDDQSAYDAWWKMVTGRYTKHIGKIEMEDHPKAVQESLKNLRPDQFGFNMFGYADA